LYIGKSVNIKDRVKSHFQADHRSSNEMNISRQITDIEAIETPGELGALLLEQHLIKTRQPLYNRKLRLAKKIVVLKSSYDERGYIRMLWETVDRLSPKDLKSVRGIFKSPSQCKSELRHKAKEHRLCEHLLGLEKRAPCFASQLGTCQGACTGHESALYYNNRLLDAFAGSSIKSWPFPGPIAIVEKDRDREQSEGFVIDQWCYIGRVTQQEQDAAWEYTNEYVFDYDVYKILVKYILNPPRSMKIHQLPAAPAAAATSSTA
jgi:DNA polymerase-3 subunit epsilon